MGTTMHVRNGSGTFSCLLASARAARAFVDGGSDGSVAAALSAQLAARRVRLHEQEALQNALNRLLSLQTGMLPHL